MNDIQIFQYRDQPVRTVQRDGEPWFVLKDVASILAIENHKDLPKRLEQDEVGRFELPHPQSPEKTVEMVCINESGLYNVILRSDKPEARPFRKWVTAEVLPSIRKTGGYISGQDSLSPEELMAKALMVAQKTLAERDARISALTVENQILQPKAEYFDQLVDRNLLTGFRETAKLLEVSPKRFVDFLLEKKYIYRDQKGKLMPYAEKNNGLFELKERFNDKTQWTGTQTLITPKGRETFRLLMVM